ncbi:MAG TPA: hypothetical protein VJJ27_01690 [Candidatus Paceibacterota bacterium]
MNDFNLKDHFLSLDSELQDFIVKDDWRKTLRKICTDRGVRDESQLAAAENETVLIMIGLEYVEDLPTLLQNAGMPKIQAEPIAEQIAKEILFKVAEHLVQREEEQALPDASKGLIADHEEIIKNPVGPTTPVPPPPQQPPAQIKNSQPATNNSQPAPATFAPPNKFPEEKFERASQNLKGQAINLSWEERKKKAEEALKKVIPGEFKKYPGSADPYREPIQ